MLINLNIVMQFNNLLILSVARCESLGQGEVEKKIKYNNNIIDTQIF